MSTNRDAGDLGLRLAHYVVTFMIFGVWIIRSYSTILGVWDIYVIGTVDHILGSDK